MAFPLINPILQFFDNSGNVLSGGKLFSYAPGTTTKKTTYSDENLSVPNANPIILDSAGRCTVFLTDGEEYKFVLTSSTDTDPPANPIRTVDEVKSPSALSQASVGAVLYPRTASEISAGITPSNYAYPEGYLLRYLSSFTSDSTDCTTGLLNMLAVGRIAGCRMILPAGIIRYTSTIALDTTSLHLEGTSLRETLLKKVGNFVGITVTSECSLRNFTLTSAGGADASAGITIRDQGRVDFRDLYITAQGSHGIWPQQCSLSYFANIVCLSNAGDGIRLDATVAPVTASSFVNANTFINIDCRGNAGNGFNMVEAYSNYIVGLTCQNNTGDGLRLDNARGNFISAYCEFNTGDEIELTNNANCRGNFLILVEGTVNDGSPTDSNTIFRTNRAGTYDSHVRKFTAMKWIVPSDAYDGSSYTGTLDLTHTANRTFKFSVDGFAGSQSLVFENAQSGGLDLVGDRITLKEAAAAVGASQVGLGSSTASTVGAAGGASALPATPTGYWIINIAGTAYKIPYYAS